MCQRQQNQNSMLNLVACDSQLWWDWDLRLIICVSNHRITESQTVFLQLTCLMCLHDASHWKLFDCAASVNVQISISNDTFIPNAKLFERCLFLGDDPQWQLSLSEFSWVNWIAAFPAAVIIACIIRSPQKYSPRQTHYPAAYLSALKIFLSLEWRPHMNKNLCKYVPVICDMLYLLEFSLICVQLMLHLEPFVSTLLLHFYIKRVQRRVSRNRPRHTFTKLTIYGLWWFFFDVSNCIT